MPYYNFDQLTTKTTPDSYSFEDYLAFGARTNDRYLSSRSWISYGSGRSRANFCEQLVFSQKVTPWLGNATTMFGSNTDLRIWYRGLSPEDLLARVRGYDFPDLAAMIHATSVNKANDFSLVNFLAELGELPSIYKGTGLLEIAEKSSRKVIVNKKVRRDLGRIGVSLPLFQQFAVAPLLSDIAGFGETMVRASQTIDNLNALAALPTKVYGDRRYNVDVTIPFAPEIYGDIPYKLRLVGTVKTSSGGTITGRINMSPEVVRLKSLLDHAGVYIDGAVVWEAIPFSFLIDYVLPVGQWLEKARDPWVRPDFYPKGLWQSFKAELVYEVIWDQPNYWRSGVPFPVTLCSGKLKYFRRDPLHSIQVPPSRGEFPKFKLPSPRQGGIAVALALDKYVR